MALDYYQVFQPLLHPLSVWAGACPGPLGGHPAAPARRSEARLMHVRRHGALLGESRGWIPALILRDGVSSKSAGGGAVGVGANHRGPDEVAGIQFRDFVQNRPTVRNPPLAQEDEAEGLEAEEVEMGGAVHR